MNTRREFLEFMGYFGALGAITSLPQSITGCVTTNAPTTIGFSPLAAMQTDQLELAKGFTSKVLIRWGDAIGKAIHFGYNNDYNAFLPIDEMNAKFWTNHEFPISYFVSDLKSGMARTRAQVDLERKSVGGSLVHLQRENINADWKVDFKNKNNFRIDATTRIPFEWHESIAGSKYAIGTLANCSGGVTPWGNVLTCEENFDEFYGDIDFFDKKIKKMPKENFNWQPFYTPPPEHYGWVTEVNPKTKKAKKLVALGRFAHEAATLAKASDGRLVVYMGDDTNNQCIYKFISDAPDSLATGSLYVADIAAGRWISLNIRHHGILQKYFKSQTEVLIFTRAAAQLVGGTPMNRPEDIDIDPISKSIIVSLTNNKDKNDLHGSLLRITENDSDPLSKEFISNTYIAGGVSSGFACPDNLAFDRHGNLWMTSDMSEDAIAKGTYKKFGNNSLFYIPMRGPDAGLAIRVANAPMDAEFTGPCFSDDGKTLFLSVQHPGARSAKTGTYTSHWPDGGESMPRPAVVMITGPLIT